MHTGLSLWITALILAVIGLVAVLRHRLVIGALLIMSGLALGLYSSKYLS